MHPQKKQKVHCNQLLCNEVLLHCHREQQTSYVGHLKDENEFFDESCGFFAVEQIRLKNDLH